MSKKLRINVGCGMSPTPGWQNFDNSWSVKLAHTPLRRLMASRADYMATVRKNDIRYANALNLPVADASAEVVYSSHMLEHLDRVSAKRFLAEVERVLAKGGKVRIVVPDLARYVADYARSGDANRFISALDMSHSRKLTFKGRIAAFFVGFRAHHWMYDAHSLTQLVEEAGFIDIITLQAGATSITDSGPLDLSERDGDSLYLEATKA